MTRYSGRQPLRPSLGAEYAVAVVWAEAALQAARAEAERAEVTQFLETARAEHNRRWVEPRRGNFPNEVTIKQKYFFLSLSGSLEAFQQHKTGSEVNYGQPFNFIWFHVHKQ